MKTNRPPLSALLILGLLLLTSWGISGCGNSQNSISPDISTGGSGGGAGGRGGTGGSVGTGGSGGRGGSGGSTISGTGGTSGRVTALCGNGRLESGETCDDWNTVSGDGCSSTCQTEARYSCPIAGRPCTPMGTGGSGGSGEVTGPPEPPVPTLGSGGSGGSVGAAGAGGSSGSGGRGGTGGSVGTGGSGGATTARCGNGRIDAGETCDDRNTTAGDGCSATCQIENGFLCHTYQHPDQCERGYQIAYVASPGSVSNIYVTDISVASGLILNAGEPSTDLSDAPPGSHVSYRITNNTRSGLPIYSHPTVRSDRRKIAYTAFTGFRAVPREVSGSGFISALEIHISRLDGGLSYSDQILSDGQTDSKYSPTWNPTSPLGIEYVVSHNDGGVSRQKVVAGLLNDTTDQVVGRYDLIGNDEGTRLFEKVSAFDARRFIYSDYHDGAYIIEVFDAETGEEYSVPSGIPEPSGGGRILPLQGTEPSVVKVVYKFGTGTKLAWVGMDHGLRQIYTANLSFHPAQTGTPANYTIENLRKLTNSGNNTAPAWTPDGRYLFYVSDVGGDREIYLMAADGSGARALTNNSYDDLDPAVFPFAN